MNEIRIERSQDAELPQRQTIAVSGDATIGQTHLLREALLKALETASELRVDFSGVTGADLTALQLVCAAHQSADRAGKRLELFDGGNEIFRRAVAEAGFQRHVGCSGGTTSSCIWVGGGN